MSFWEDFIRYLSSQREWSRETFGEGLQTGRLCGHIREELLEIEESPSDVVEWVDVLILALDGAWRTGNSPGQIINAMIEKQKINRERKWEVASPDNPVHHIKESGE